MALLPIIDNLLNNIQRQGKISFYVRIFPSIPYLILRVTFELDDRCAHIVSSFLRIVAYVLLVR
jgi:hypothetical protein